MGGPSGPFADRLRGQCIGRNRSNTLVAVRHIGCMYRMKAILSTPRYCFVTSRKEPTDCLLACRLAVAANKAVYYGSGGDWHWRTIAVSRPAFPLETQ